MNTKISSDAARIATEIAEYALQHMLPPNAKWDDREACERDIALIVMDDVCTCGHDRWFHQMGEGECQAAQDCTCWGFEGARRNK